MENKNYPNYYIAGDDASLKAQSRYVRFVKFDLLLMVFSALICIYNYQTEDSKLIVYILSGVMLLFALFISIILKFKKYEDVWYRGRALAESCKTLTWRFIMCSEYFESGLSGAEADNRFIGRIREINDEFNDLTGVLVASKLALPVITGEMNRIRSLSLEDRKAFYLNKRITNQIEWYSSKADSNKSKYENWFWMVIASQLLALLSIGYLVACPTSNFNMVGLFSTISASGFSWLQLKKYQENKEAYTTATSELNLIKEEANRYNTDTEFAKYVLDSENAMSREHTMWLAQKRR
ncbi:DUF4231 domain-containing protein [Sphingobacteriaceae bacterium WQ 2009]|uniref:DUF4231 domain-containing protein n=1 Tax=Rhinopithecimicrobium faecis TaxID=2820698 RepID=A0A8T4HC74_9SPHI|nr:DUF4231 domain-containing protein [Sphingobacteriaceae bacterium WQ 2009]